MWGDEIERVTTIMPPMPIEPGASIGWLAG